MLLQLLLAALTWLAVAELVAGLVALALWYGYGRVIVTPAALTVVGCGLWGRPRYTSPLAEVKLEGQWALASAPAAAAVPTLAFYTDWDWDTPQDYLVIEYRGEAIAQFFSLQQFAEIRAAVAQMAACAATPGTTSTPVTPDYA